MAHSAPSSVSTKAWKHDRCDLPILFERYQILGILGEGGMGTVFKGYHVNLKRYVAIKTLRVDHRQSPEMVGRFLKEMESVGQMDHPNVVRASDAGEKNGIFYLVMEYLHGSDLSRLVAQKGRLEIAAACELTRQAALGLEHIHQTLIHRDIKPSNLMLTTAGLVKILDLGLARLGFGEPGDREKTPKGCAVGTYAYMAPEQASSGAAIDGRADIYSLGCTLFKLLTGQPPYSGPEFDNAAQVINAHCHIPLTEVAAFESVPEGLRSVLLKMMAKDPDDRFRSGREVADALTPFGGESSLVHLLPPGSAKESAGDTPVKGLPSPLPDELSRLTDAPHETPPHTSSMTGSTFGVVKPTRRRNWRHWQLGAAGTCILACALAPLLWYFALVPVRPLTPDPPETARGAVTASGWRDLDTLPVGQHHFLLAQKPFALGGELANPRAFHWQKDGAVVDFVGGRKEFLILGQTTRSRFTFEAALSQTPWTGNVGIFWGYRENEKSKQDQTYKKERTHGPFFATFQMLKFVQEVGAQRERLYFVSRVKGRVRYNKEGDLSTDIFTEVKQRMMPPRNGIGILHIEVVDDRPKFAKVSGLLLDELYSAKANLTNPLESCQGALGLISLTHPATFRDARFIMHSNN